MYFCTSFFFKMKILVLTLHDDFCGPMAAAFLSDYSQKLEVVSAGINPSEDIHPLVIMAMKECLVDLSGTKPTAFSDFDLSEFDYILLIGVETSFPQIDAAKAICMNPEIEVTGLDSVRLLRDWIKNEVFIIYKSRFH